jgi:signal transduction histidine kinase
MTSRYWKQAVFWGCLAAVAANVRFEIPGLGYMDQDPRGIFTLLGILMIRTWPQAATIGAIAGLGDLHRLSATDGVLSVLIYIILAMAAWLIYTRLLEPIRGQVTFALSWIAMVVLLFDLFLVGFFSLSRVLVYSESLSLVRVLDILKRYQFGAAATIVVTCLGALLIRALRENEQQREVHLKELRSEIEDRKLAESEREDVHSQLVQSKKMEAVGILAGGVAHDFNNFLTIINSHSEMAMTRLEPNSSVYRHLQAIRKAGKRAGELTRQLLSFARKQPCEPRTLDLRQVIGDFEKMLLRTLGDDISFETRFTSDAPPVKADPGQLQQILLNLVLNARDAVNARRSGSRPKRITVDCSRVVIRSTDSLVASNPECAPGHHLLLQVSDNGIGMSTAQRERVFEPFFTTKREGRGTGLGLAIVYGAVKQNGGAIMVSSQRGKGSIFSIYWPAADDETIDMMVMDQKDSKADPVRLSTGPSRGRQPER